MLGGLFAQLNQVARRVPAGSTLYVMAQRAKAGDPEALEYLKSNGLFDALDLLHPGAGRAAALIKDHVSAARNGAGTGATADGDYPWAGFLNRLLKQPNSAQIILGPTGSGKTSFAKKLAWRLSEVQGYRVEAVNWYGEDCPPFAKVVSTDTLVRRMKQLTQHLASLEEDDDEDESLPTAEDKEKRYVAPPAPNKVVIIDEASLAMSSNAQDPARRAALQALWQTRHLRWHVVYIAQTASQLPTQLWGQSIVWTKEPAGREKDTDRDNPVVRAFWAEAEQRFRYIRKSEYWAPPYENAKSWCFVDCVSLNGGPGYTGMFPWTPYSPQDVEATAE